MFSNARSLAFGALLALGVATPGVAAQNAPAVSGMEPQVGAPGQYYAPYAQAIALVEDGTVTGAKGVSAFSHPAVGIYCLKLATGIQLQTAPVITVEWAHSLGVVLFAQWDQDNISCSGATTSTVEVRTYKGDSGGVGSGYVIPALSNSVSFVVLVP
jgi:hypothetical protein